MKINPVYTLDKVKSDYGVLGYEIAVRGYSGNIICQFDSLYTAALCARFFSGASLRSYEKDSVLMALDKYDARIAKQAQEKEVNQDDDNKTSDGQETPQTGEGKTGHAYNSVFR